MATRTYYCGDGGSVRRLDNFSGPWVDVSPGGKVLYDIMTSPIDSDHVITVGDSSIFISTDAGNNWSIPGGNWTVISPLPVWFEVWFVDTNTIYVVGSSGYCVKSIDGGLTFNITPTLPTPTGLPVLQFSSYAVHFQTPLLGVAAFEDSVFKTTDGGTTWIYTNGGLPINTPQTIVRFKGIHISLDGLIITAWGEGGVYRSIDGGTSYLFPLDFIYPPPFTARPGEHLTWLNDGQLWGTTRQNEIFQSINAGASWTSLRTPDTSGFDSSRIRAAHFYTASEGFYSINSSLYSTSDAGVSGTLSDTNQLGEIWAVWTFLGTPCYTLTPCTPGFGFITSTDLSLYVGQYINLSGTCYLVGISDTCTGAVDIGNSFTVFDDCETCIPLSCFLLVPCPGIGGPSHLVTGTFTLGTVVTVEEFAGCFIVSEIITPCNGIPATIVTEYPDCDCCIPDPPPPPDIPFEQSVDPIEKSFSRVTDTECVITTNETFADAYYQKYKQLKNGINTCGTNNLDKLWLDKELLDIRSTAIDIDCCIVPEDPPPSCP